MSLIYYFSIPFVFLLGMFMGSKLGEHKALMYCCKKLREVDNEPLRRKR